MSCRSNVVIKVWIRYAWSQQSYVCVVTMDTIAVSILFYPLPQVRLCATTIVRLIDFLVFRPSPSNRALHVKSEYSKYDNGTDRIT